LDEKDPECKPGDYTYFADEPLYWEVYVNGRLIECGIQKMTVKKY
jgi:hypothetical protein